MKKGSRMRVEKVSRYAAMARGPASLILIRMEAVDTATMLTNSATFGGNPGLSPTANHG